MHPILDALDRTPYEWLKKLLFIFNEGHIGKFDALAPVFPQVVRMTLAAFTSRQLLIKCPFCYRLNYPAHLAAELLVYEAKDLPHGPH